MPGGLSSFSVVLPVKNEELVLKDLPKTIKTTGTSKKNFREVMEALNLGLGDCIVSEDGSFRE
jgi:hypothetical protein